ncbi:ECF transporter S component [Harryflintia acetispora]|uniref:Riboflavin transporter n=1 Tax=Harryflintia acetispora TaxID=1849041 RepID=A0A9X8UI79_9FIRM|nr:ECF transporter S component [Harryflintia acetispora]TCL42821.1 riboflavin transporter FmnP [Harryflintia acetispora]
MKASQTTRKLTTMAMLTALSIVLVAIVHFPLFPAAPWMEYDPADIPIFIGTFLFGPGAGLALTLVVSIIQGTTVSASSGIIGILMHFCATGSFAILAGNIYRKKHTRGGAMIALAAGVVTMTAVMALWNLIFTPIFMGAPRQAVLELMLPVILPFNLIKAGANALITYLVYKPIARLVRHEEGGLPARS